MRRCRACKEEKPLDAYGWPEARTCDECAAPTPCVICGVLCPNRFKTCRSVACLHKLRVQVARRGGKTTARQRRKAASRRTTRTCAGCEKQLPLTTEFFYVATRDHETGDVLKFDHYCKPCNRINQRLLYRMNADRRRKALESAKRQRQREQARRQTDPEYDRAYRERRQGYQEAYKQRNRGDHPGDTSPIARSERVDIEPFRLWLEDRLSQYDTIEDFCDCFPISPKTVYEIRTHRRDSVQIDTVDAVLQEEGNTLLEDLYPPLAEGVLA